MKSINMFSPKTFFQITFVLVAVLAVGILSFSSIPVQAQANTWYVDGTNGNDNNNGSAQAPWKSVQKAISSITPGSTVVIRAGIYRVDRIRFGPSGTGSTARTIFRSAPGERVIFSRPDDLPPQIEMDNYVRIEGLWFGGRWDKAGNGGHFQPGGSPIGTGKQIVNCTIFGYKTGINIGSSQHLLIQGNRLVHNGNAEFDHGMYISGGGPTGSMTNHIIIDNNVVLVGEGYGIHGWHDPDTIIVTRNFISGHRYGLVMGGTGSRDHLIANNLIWKQPSRGAQIPGTNTIYINNIHGPTTGIIDSQYATNLMLRNNAFWDNSPGPRGSNAIAISSSQSQSALGISESQIDAAITALDQKFNQTVQAIYGDSTIEPQFQTLRSFNIPQQSPLHNAGINWMGGGTPRDLGTGIQAPVDEADFWRVYRNMGLREYDSNGNLIQTTPVPPTSTPRLPTATFTRTPLPPSATLTPTPIPPTATFTSTPLPPTATFTHTPIPPTATFSPTPLPPTATFTGTPVLPTATATLPPVGNSPSIEVVVNPASANPGDTVAITLSLNNMTNLYGFEVMCQVNPSILSGTNYAGSSGFNENNSYFIDTGYNTADGTWHVAVTRLRPNPAITGNDTAFILNYIVQNVGSTSVDCAVLAADINGYHMDVEVVGGFYNSEVPSPPTPTVAISLTETVVLSSTPIPTIEAPTPVPGGKSIISGIVNFPAKTDHAGITVSLLSSEGNLLVEVVTNSNGAFSFTDVPIGAYILQFSAPHSLIVQRNIMVESDESLVDLGTYLLLVGDTDDNGLIDLNDAGLIGANFGISVPPAPLEADVNADGLINIVDLTLIGASFNMVEPIVLN